MSQQQQTEPTRAQVAVLATAQTRGTLCANRHRSDVAACIRRGWLSIAFVIPGTGHADLQITALGCAALSEARGETTD